MVQRQPHCLKDKSGKILSQDLHCQELCGKRTAKICRDRCMDFYPLKLDSVDESQNGAYLTRNKKIGGEFFDIVFIVGPENIQTILVPLSEKLQAEQQYFKSHNLTQRESEILKLIGEGMQNREISEKLGIKKSTLKTHLNNAYKKIAFDHRPERAKEF